MKGKKCQYEGCTKLASRFNAKYCKKHAELNKKASWRRSKQKKRLQFIEPESKQWWKYMNKLIPNQPHPTQQPDETLQLLRQIKKNTDKILKRLDKKK